MTRLFLLPVGLRRRISTADMASRLFVSRDTLWRLERGDPSVAIGTLATAVYVLQLHDRLAALAAADRDALGLDLDTAALPQRIRSEPTLTASARGDADSVGFGETCDEGMLID